MTTFSQLVDQIVSEIKRPDMLNEVATYLNQTLREVHFQADRNTPLFYQDNFKESLLVATSDVGMTWQIPNPATYQRLWVVKFMSVWTRDGQEVWSKETTPGRHLQDLFNYHYRVGDTYVFYGYGGMNAQIALGWYEYTASLKYKSAAARPASYDFESGWSYADGVTTPELQAAARMLTTNWLLMRWSDVIAEGVRAKVYKRVSDDARSRTSYSLYGALRQGLWTAESAIPTP